MISSGLFQIVGPFVSLLSLFVNLYSCYLILRKSPSSISTYRYFMLYFTTYDTLFTMTLLLFQPEPLVVLLGVVVHGPLRFISHPAVGHVALTLCTFLGVQMMCALNWSVLYRFLVIWRHGEYFSLLLRPRCIVFALALGWVFAFGLSSIVPQAALDEESFIKSSIEEGVYDIIRERLANSEIVFGYQMISTTSIVFLSIFGATGISFSYGLNISTAVYITRTLKRMRATMSPATFRMHKQLAALLFVQGIYPLTILAPIIFLIASYPLGFTNVILRNKTFMSVGLLVLECYPLLNGLSTIFFVSTFRHHLLRVLSRFFSLPRLVKSQVAPPLIEIQRPASITLNDVASSADGYTG